MTTSPDTAAFVLPVTRDKAPDPEAPLVATPVATVTYPEFPLDATPELNNKWPESPDVLAAPPFISMCPVPPDTDAPTAKTKEPVNPVSEVPEPT
jgi:hypothetical protein